MGSRSVANLPAPTTNRSRASGPAFLVPSRIRDPELLTRTGRSRSREPRTRRFGRSLRETPVDRWPRVVRSSRGQPPKVARLLATPGTGGRETQERQSETRAVDCGAFASSPCSSFGGWRLPCDRATPKRPSGDRPGVSAGARWRMVRTLPRLCHRLSTGPVHRGDARAESLEARPQRRTCDGETTQAKYGPKAACAIG
jgi:hypothetical protein